MLRGSRYTRGRFVIVPIEGFDRLPDPGVGYTAGTLHPVTPSYGVHVSTAPRIHVTTTSQRKANGIHFTTTEG